MLLAFALAAASLPTMAALTLFMVVEITPLGQAPALL
jgi:hypothetical protein